MPPRAVLGAEGRAHNAAQAIEHYDGAIEMATTERAEQIAMQELLA